MYYPLLRARQFELISIRELAAEGVIRGYVCPVLEPVKKSLNNLNLANKALLDSDQIAYLIVNPLVGELPGDQEYFSSYLHSLERCGYLPAFYYMNNADFIEHIINKYDFNDCMLICNSNYADDDRLRDLSATYPVSRIMVLEPQKNRRLDRFFKSLGKIYIRLDDAFERQEKNADFLDIQAHRFSEEHLFYKEDGYQGFSDFTVLPSEYSEGGSTPRAVVIHLTYINSEANNEIWIRHFTSENNGSTANVQGKFAEAAKKAVNFCDTYPLYNSAIKELRDYYYNRKYPGLGMIKKISIKNHLLVVTSYLR